MGNTEFNASVLLTGDLENLRSWQDTQLKSLKLFPVSKERNPKQKKAVRAYFDALAELRAQLIATYVNEVYSAVTNNFSELVRVEDIVYRISEQFPGLAPTRSEIFQDDLLFLSDKEGHELSQGLILSELLSMPVIGEHLMSAMRRPKNESLFLLEQFQQQNYLQFETVTITKKNNTAYLHISNQSFLNAEDGKLNSDLECAADIILLDPRIEIAVIRGDVMHHSKYKGKRVFCSGVNLTKLYRGELPYLFYVIRELGFISKIYHGLLLDEKGIKKAANCAIEKPWISVVDTHAIGGGFQMLLVSDYVIAESGSFLSIPARREGFIPGLANLRLPRYVGQRLANQLIYKNYQIVADSDEGKKIVDEVVIAESIDDSLSRVVNEMTEFGIAGFISNRKAIRLGAEPLSVFQQYMASFCREQVKCMFGQDIVTNLEKFWIKRNQTV